MDCLYYYARTDANNFPIPGTMTGTPFALCGCHQTRLFPTDTPTGTVDGITYKQIYQPHGLRYFVRIDCDINGVKTLIPNSLFISKQHPGGKVAEWKNTYIAS